MRQLPRAAPDLGRHSGRAKISLVRLSHPREKRFWRRRPARRRSAVRRGNGKGPQVRPSHAFHLRHRQRTQPRRMGRHRARTRPARLPFSKHGEVQHHRTHRRRPRRAQVAPENHAHQTRDRARTGEASRRRNRVRRGAVREAARAPQTTRRRTRRAALHRFLRRGACGRWRGFIRRATRSSRASAAWARRSCASSARRSWREIAAHLQTNPRQIFADDSFAEPVVPPRRSRLTDTVRETLHFFRQGKTVADIARDSRSQRRHDLRASRRSDAGGRGD